MNCLICLNENLPLRTFKHYINCDKVICNTCLDRMENNCPFCRTNFFIQTARERYINTSPNVDGDIDKSCFLGIFWRIKQKFKRHNKWYKEKLFMFCCIPLYWSKEYI